jgi:hypothetical protein
MAIRALSRQEFNWFGSARSAFARVTSNAVEWFTDDADSVFGAIVYQECARDWSFIIVTHDTYGDFRALDRHSGLHTVDEARRVLSARMETATALATKIQGQVRVGSDAIIAIDEPRSERRHDWIAFPSG